MTGAIGSPVRRALATLLLGAPEAWPAPPPADLVVLDAPFAAMRRPVVDDPEDPFGGAVGRPRHQLSHQPLEGRDTDLVLAASKDASPAHIPGCQVSPGAPTLILMLDSGGLSGCGRQGFVLAASRLDAGLLVGTDHEISRSKRPALPEALVEVEDRPGPFREEGISREDPAPVVPRSDGVLRQPAPKGGLSDRSDQAAAEDLPFDLADAEAGEWQPEFTREFAGEGLYLDDGLGGKRVEAVHGVAALRGRRSPVRRSAFATY